MAESTEILKALKRINGNLTRIDKATKQMADDIGQLNQRVSLIEACLSDYGVDDEDYDDADDSEF